MRRSRYLLCALALGCADANVEDGVLSIGSDASAGLPPVPNGNAPIPDERGEPNPGPDNPNPRPDPDDPDNPDPGPDDPPPNTDPDPGCPTGGVVGLACAPDGTPIAGAVISAETTDCDGNRVVRSTEARGDGGFTLEGLAAGPTTVVVEAGSFVGRYEVVIAAGQRVQLDERSDKECLPADAAQIAVTSGEYDSIETIVSRLGFERDVYCGDTFGNFGARGLFGDWERLSTYDVVMVNCGLSVDFTQPQSRVMVDNLRRFVEQGGSLYISDLAASLVHAAWPEKISFRAELLPGFPLDPCCSCVDCPPECGANVEAPRLGGACQGTLGNARDLLCIAEAGLFGDEEPGRRRATVRSEPLRRFLGRDTLDIEFETGGWVAIDRVAPDVEVLVEADGEPLMVLFEDRTSGGRVAFTTFHNEAQVAADVEQILRALVFQL